MTTTISLCLTEAEIVLLDTLRMVDDKPSRSEVIRHCVLTVARSRRLNRALIDAATSSRLGHPPRARQLRHMVQLHLHDLPLAE